MKPLAFLVSLALGGLVLGQSILSPKLTVRLPDGGYVTVAPTALDAGLPDGSVVLDSNSATSCFCNVAGATIATTQLPDGGVVPAPRGVTLSNCTGTGCKPKPCTALWVGPPGYDETWGPTGCPTQ